MVLDEADELKSRALASALTSSVFEARELGTSHNLGCPQRATWMATGNNIRVAGDLPRRCYRIRLDAKTDKPWQREGFLHEDLQGLVTEQRGRLLAAGLTLARAWFVADRPVPKNVPVVGGFNSWSKVMAGVLACAGIDGFLGNLPDFYAEADADAVEWEAFLAAWYERWKEPIGAAEVARAVQEAGALQAALPDDLAETVGNRGFNGKLGKALAKRADTRFGETGLRLARAGKDSRGGTLRWRVLTDGDGEA